MKITHFSKRLLAALCAAVIASAALSGCGAGASGGKGLDAAFDYAKAKVQKFSSSEAKRNASFADSAFSKANAVAMMVNEKTTEEDFQWVARNMFVDSITVTDDKGTVVACYPEGEKGSSLKDSEDKKVFMKVVKGVAVKLMSDPQPVEDSNEYSLMAGVARTDAPGAVVIGYKTDEYADVIGSTLADSCGVNTVILSDNAVLSSTMESVEPAAALDKLGISADDISKGSFSMKAGDASYQCKSAKVGSYTLISAEPV